MRITSLPKAPRRARRGANIVRKLLSHGLGFLVTQLDIRQLLPASARLRVMGAQMTEPHELPQRFARVLEELGPTFVKFGQVLSTRPDLLPSEYIDALTRICHNVAPFPSEVARSIVEEELGRPVDEVFSDFSAIPLASGSMAQVHTARLPGGTEVVVKVRRPGIELIIDDDLAIMEYLADRADRVEEFHPFRLPMVVDEFAQGIRRELNFLSEAAHTHRFHMAFEDNARVHVPRVYWDQTTSRILTMERMTGTLLSEIQEFPDFQRLKPDVARLILDCFLHQFFDIGAFHADPHVGNILVSDNGDIALIDFGLVGRLGEKLRGQLSTCMIALGSNQMDFAAEIMGEMGAVPAGADSEEFCAEVGRLLERTLGIPFDKLDLQRMFLDIMGIVRKYRVIMPRDFVLLGKALVTVGGMARQLAPSLNAAELAEPYARKLAREKVAPAKLGRALTANAHHVAMLLKNAPRDLRLLLRRLKTGSFDFNVRHMGLDKYLSELDRTGNRLALSIILAAIIISSTRMMEAGVGPVVTLFDAEASILGIMGYTLGFVLGVLLIIGIFRSGRL